MHVEAVVGNSRFGERAPGDKHHRRGQIKRYLPDRFASGQRYLLQYGNDRLGLGSAYGSHQGSLAAMSVAVGHERVQFAATERRLIYGKVGPDILWIKDILLSMTELLPLAVIAENLLVLPGQIGSVNAIMRRNRTDAFRRGLNPPLLKKLRTPGLADCLPPQDHSCK